MRSMPSNYEMVNPGTLVSVLDLLNREPGVWTPVAGGTEIMVQFGTGRLDARRLVNIWGIPELRHIEARESELWIGAGCTYSELRRDAIVTAEFPLLSMAASWTGSIANQNRGTLGGNIVNASPAADSLPALLVYDAELVLASARGERRVRYAGFHREYKQMGLMPDELIRSIVLPRRFAQYYSFTRKVGTRNAQAISKLCMAALAKVDDDRIKDIRIAMGSMAPVPLRLKRTEEALLDKEWSEGVLRSARRALEAEVNPIDDIRSTRAFRVQVAGNLLEEFLRGLFEGKVRSNAVLRCWNRLPLEDATEKVLSCCGSRVWARALAEGRPYDSDEALFRSAGEIWRGLTVEDWMEAFRGHPRIGERLAERATTSAMWSAAEQSSVQQAETETRRAIAEGNRRYEKRFGRIFIICASGQQPRQILEALDRRLGNDDETEMRESAAQQEQILQMRLRKWLAKPEET